MDSSKLDVGLAADICAGACNVLTVSPEKVRQIIAVVKEIDDALSENYSGVILYANKRASSLFPEIVFAPQTGVIKTDEVTLSAMPFTIQRDSLLGIRKALVSAVSIQKAGQILEEVGHIALKQVVRNIMND